MSDPYAPGLDVPFDSETDPWIQYTSWILYFIGASYVLMGVGLGGLVGVLSAFLGSIAQSDDDMVGAGVGMVEGVFILVLCGGIGAVALAGGWGFGNKAKWAWFVAIILGAMFVMSICAPFGLGLLYGCLNERTRKTFLG